MNVAIFESLHFSSLAIVDVTGERPNCFIELGYGSWQRQNRVLVTAEEGTKLPFDQEMIPCHFWKPSRSVRGQEKGPCRILGKEHQQATDCEESMTNRGGTVREVYISVDIEAAGPVPSTFSMLSLGAVVVDDPKNTFYVELKPANDKFVPDAMKVVGRTLRTSRRTGREPKEAMTAFRDWLVSVAKAAKPVFVGFNATFDWAFVNFYFQSTWARTPLDSAASTSSPTTWA